MWTTIFRFAGQALKYIGFGWLFSNTVGDDDSTPSWIWTLVGFAAAVVLFFFFFGDRGRKALMRIRR